ncbi:MAG: isoprenylcysteine carboxylmethyltransferase family protein [Hyphomicrobiales bacterium]|nr:isoprenylcysteine carboxylmethyltransferase family protein [Hyphomicrobiales bacterium]
MTQLVAQWVWFIGGVLWFVVRYPHQRRSRKTKVARSTGGTHDQVLLGFSLTGLAIIPLIYFISGEPRFADYGFSPSLAWIGVVLMLAALALLYETHRQLGRNWSVTLDTRKKHTLIDTGLYGYVRHPMYSAFWLLALAQAALLSNWIAGLSGIVGWGILYFLRVGREEQLMIETFGDIYRDYMKRTKRVIPLIY